ncbi:MAG: chromosome segregation protein SMC [Candidatus Nitrospinota bacterium M3_3B_026]
MYFKSITMRGFKSFVDETKMEFEPGVTAVVGPNGCGKSNIADALRWVLGEQSARLMRGVRMEDFIFNGAAGRKPSAFAEVYITISNADGSITAHPYSEYEEITVGRKLYRTGESEYYINGVPCRLKDVVDVFLDTGVSARAFSIIEQGQVTRIVNSKPEERRFIIEEAAGVMKYKNRRNAAMNKLEASQQNLLRVQDILGELERQRNSLNRQAKKAERYKSYRTEIKNRAMAHYAVEAQEKAGRLERVAAESEEAEEKEAGLAAALSTRRNEMETLGAEIEKMEGVLAGLREERSRLSAALERNESHRELLARQLEELSVSGERAGEEIEQTESEIVRLDELIAGRGADMERLASGIEADESRLAGLKEQSEDLRRELAGLKEKSAAAGREAMAALERISSARDAQSSLSARLEMTEEKINSLSGREDELFREVAAMEEDLEDLRRGLDEKNLGAGRAREENAEIKASLDMGEDALEAVEEELKKLEGQITKLVSRRESLQDLDRNLEGFGAGVRGLMKRKEEGAGEARGVKGLLADGVRAPEGMEAALAAALGSRLEAVIMDNSENSLAAARLMKEENMGRAGLFPADLAPAPAAPLGSVDHPSLVGRASDVFSLPPGAPRGVVLLLERTLIARDLQGAMEIWRSAPGACHVVTVDGDMIDAEGLVTAGSAGAGHGADIVARKRMIEDLAVSVQQMERERAEVEGRRASLAESVKTERDRLAESSERLRRLEMEALDLSREIDRKQEAIASGRSRLEALSEEARMAAADKERFAAESVGLTEELSTLTERKAALDEEAARLGEETERLGARLEQAMGGVREEEVALAERRGRLENLRLDMKRQEGAKAELLTRVQRLKDSIQDYGRRREEIRGTMDSLARENVELARRKEEVSSRVVELSETLEAQAGKRKELDGEARRLRDELEEARSRVSELAVRKSELQMRVENVIEKADDEFNIPAEDLFGFDTSDVDVEQTRQRLSFLRGELGRMGDVNMSALEEFEEVNERYEFMKKQSEDLTASINHLRKTIDNINATTRSMFNKTFETVSRNFEMVFRRLFGGGHAEMRLVEEEGKPEPGLEVLVQPPGKKVQNLNLLSAGEKAMTAIALLFAVFLAKPSPFCLLDEVDAPLDEANIFRFRDMLMEMREKTQFIIITHNQKTMSFAERLYGVTQEEEGVSRIISVSLAPKRGEEAVLSAA